MLVLGLSDGSGDRLGGGNGLGDDVGGCVG